MWPLSSMHLHQPQGHMWSATKIKTAKISVLKEQSWPAYKLLNQSCVTLCMKVNISWNIKCCTFYLQYISWLSMHEISGLPHSGMLASMQNPTQFAKSIRLEAWNSSMKARQIFTISDTAEFYGKLSSYSIHLNWKILIITSHEGLQTFLWLS
jgi:hypothetical protein